MQKSRMHQPLTISKCVFLNMKVTTRLVLETFLLILRRVGAFGFFWCSRIDGVCFSMSSRNQGPNICIYIHRITLQPSWSRDLQWLWDIAHISRAKLNEIIICLFEWCKTVTKLNFLGIYLNMFLRQSYFLFLCYDKGIYRL